MENSKNETINILNFNIFQLNIQTNTITNFMPLIAFFNNLFTNVKQEIPKFVCTFVNANKIVKSK